jgi:hopanoid biosynthesis associated protein HpnK
MNLSFVYPLYNEIDNLPRLLPETERIAEGLAADYEVVLVDDGSDDGSGHYADEIASRYPNVRVCHHARNRGLGAAIITGLRNASRDLVLYMDSDFPVTAEDARAALTRLEDGVDLLIGYRLGRAEGPRREFMSWAYNRLVRRAFDLHVRDVNFAFKLIRRELLERMRLRSEGSFIDAEILLEARRLGARMQEVGMRYHPRRAGRSTAASTRVAVRTVRELIGHRKRLGRAVGPVRLIVNADDFGLCGAVNRGVALAFDGGVVTSASLLPTGDSFPEAVALARERPSLGLGVHLALTQTKPVLPPEEVGSLIDGRGRFPRGWASFLARYMRRAIRRSEVEAELRAQMEAVRATGLEIAHLDSHQHLHMLPGILPVVVQLALEYNVGAVRCPAQRRGWVAGPGILSRVRRRAEALSLRGICSAGRRVLRGCGLLSADDFRGFMESGVWTSTGLARTIDGLDAGVVEICCHPGADDSIDAQLQWGYAWEQELAALTSGEVKAASRNSAVRLTTYRDCQERIA